MARIKLAYIGGGSSRGAGTVASLLAQGENFDGSDVVLIDLDSDRLAIVETIAQKLAQNAGLDIRVSSTTDRRAGLDSCDAVLTSFRPGGFEARVLDERIPLRHGVIGQETQGPGGFFMALRSISVMLDIAEDMRQVCPNGRIFNYTNPINIVSEALTHYSDVPIVSLCEGPIYFPHEIAEWAGLDPTKLDATMIGLNHACWSVRHEYDGQDFMPILQEAYDSMPEESDEISRGLVRLALTMQSIPASYMQYYYFRDDVLRMLEHKSTTRSEDILAALPDYWQHYRDQAAADAPVLDSNRSRGGINELELAIDVMDAYYNDKHEVLPCNVTNNGAIAEFPDDRVVEVPTLVSKAGLEPQKQPAMPRQVMGLMSELSEWQSMAAFTAAEGTRIDGIRALAAHPMVMSLNKAERIYDELAAAHAAYLPDRLRP